MSSALPNPTPNRQVAADITRRYEDFREAAERIIGTRIELVLAARDQTAGRLAAIEKEAQGLPQIIAAYDRELAYLRSLSVPRCPPLIVGCAHESGPRELIGTPDRMPASGEKP